MPDQPLSKGRNFIGVRISTQHLPPTEIKAENRLDASLDADGIRTLSLGTFSRKNFAREQVAQQHEMPMGDLIIKELREGERY
jgi:hypothetical protein